MLDLAVLISGGGTTLRNLIERIAAGSLDARIVAVVSSRPDAPGLKFAAAANIPSTVLRRADFPDLASYSQRVFDVCRAARATHVAMAGWLKLLAIPPDFHDRVLNIHPSLIPAFCGAGMHGLHVHAAVLAHGVRVTGCTVHFVDDQYDHGPILLQRAVPVLSGDTPQSLAARVFAAECELYPQALNLVARGQAVLKNGQVSLVPLPDRR